MNELFAILADTALKFGFGLEKTGRRYELFSNKYAPGVTEVLTLKAAAQAIAELQIGQNPLDPDNEAFKAFIKANPGLLQGEQQPHAVTFTVVVGYDIPRQNFLAHATSKVAQAWHNAGGEPISTQKIQDALAKVFAKKKIA